MGKENNNEIKTKTRPDYGINEGATLKSKNFVGPQRPKPENYEPHKPPERTQNTSSQAQQAQQTSSSSKDYE